MSRPRVVAPAAGPARHTRRALLRSGLLLAGAGLLWRRAALRPPVGAARADDAPDIVVAWNDACLAAIRLAKPAPPVVARALAVLHTCIYDAWAAYSPLAHGTEYGAGLRRPVAERTPANRRRAIGQAAYRALVDLFPEQRAAAEELLARYGHDPAEATADPAGPAATGDRAATAVLAARHADGANQLGDMNGGAPYSDYTGYRPINGPDRLVDPNRWQPLYVADGKGGLTAQVHAVPHFGLVRPFALAPGAFARPSAPAPYGTDRYAELFREIVDLGAALTDREKVIAEYWSDGPTTEFPPGHWNLFAQWLIARDNAGLDAAVRLFFALNNALLDAGIAAWDCKRAYDSIRPISAIRFLYAGRQIPWSGGGGRYTVDGAAWAPFQLTNVVTPPFSEHVSGHSTFSHAAAEVLRRFTGGDTFGASFTWPREGLPGRPAFPLAGDVTLAWPTFTAAAEEAGMSRLYGGIHIASGNLQGAALGREVGRLVAERAVGLFWPGDSPFQA